MNWFIGGAKTVSPPLYSLDAGHQSSCPIRILSTTAMPRSATSPSRPSRKAKESPAVASTRAVPPKRVATTSSGSSSHIRLRGVRQNNLKNFDLDLPLGKLIVVTGLSGSGKSSLAFETLYAEGQRRYIETFTPYARQFFDRMDKPAVDRIENIPPAIAIEQRNAVRTTRSSVGTMTEICDYLKMVWPHLSELFRQSLDYRGAGLKNPRPHTCSSSSTCDSETCRKRSSGCG